MRYNDIARSTEDKSCYLQGRIQGEGYGGCSPPSGWTLGLASRVHGRANVVGGAYNSNHV